MQNNGSKPVVFTSALHSYFAIGDVNKTTVNGLDNMRFIDALNDWEAFTQYGALKLAVR